MLARGQEAGADLAADLGVARVVVGGEELLDPLDPARDLPVNAPAELDGVPTDGTLVGWGRTTEGRKGGDMVCVSNEWKEVGGTCVQGYVVTKRWIC